MTTEVNCPECGNLRRDPETKVCMTCGAPPFVAGEHRQREGDVRSEDLEPYVTLRYIARLFKILALLMVVMLIGEVVTGIITEGQGALLTLLGEATRLLVLAGLMWGGGDITILLVDAGHDLRVARILLGRINANLHQNGADARKAEESRV
ncbi:MAG: hypothetical protein ABI024_04205 [Vicinamibacterales bacterium]